jgi:hypothetical protein
LTLPMIIKAINIEEIDLVVPQEKQQAAIRIRLINTTISELDDKYGEDVASNSLLLNLRTELENNLNQTNGKLDCMECIEDDHKELVIYRRVIKNIYRAQRKELYQLRKEKVFSDEAIRQEEMQVDIAEVRITSRL